MIDGAVPPVRRIMTRRRVGNLLSAMVVLLLAADGMIDLVAPELIEPQMTATGFPPSLAGTLGCIILTCAALYAFPRTAFLGAIFVSGFVGGAICIHFRLGEIASPPEIASAVLGAMAWGALLLRDDRLRAILPVRSHSA
jgi:hypothetical protein